ncbi:MAG: nucleotidyltransferase family protein [Faecousia sp.]
MGTTIRYSVEEIRTIAFELAAQYGAERIYLFGSYARSDANIDSDIDFANRQGFYSRFTAGWTGSRLGGCFWGSYRSHHNRKSRE